MFDEWHIENRPPTDGELIAQQARRIERLEQLVKMYDRWIDVHGVVDVGSAAEMDLCDIGDARKVLGLKND